MRRLSEVERGKVLFDCICEDVERQLNPDGDECPDCGGEGYIFDCFDGLCFDAESGCDDCMRRCPECARYKHACLKAVRLEVIKAGDVDIAREWLKSVGRWSNDITTERIKAELESGRAALAQSDDASRKREV